MWQAPSLHAESSSYSNEVVPSQEGSVSSAISDDPAENSILSRSPTTLTLCRMPVAMSSNVQSPQLRGHRRRTCSGRERIRSNRAPNFSRRCIIQNINQESVSRVSAQNEFAFRDLTKQTSSIRDNRDSYENQLNTENDTSLSDDTEHGLLNPTVSTHDSHSLETLSQSLLQLTPSYIRSSSPISQIDNSNTVNEVLLEPEPEIPLIPLIGADNTCKEPYKINTKCIGPSHILNNSKPLLLHFDDPFYSPPRIVSDFPTPTVNAKKIANSLIKLSRYLKSPDLTQLCCLDCRLVPMLPVTGQCGHTRCMRCIVDNGDCPCSANAPKTLLVNTVVREIIEKMMRYIKKPRNIQAESSSGAFDDKAIPLIGVVPRHLKHRHSRSLRLSSLANSSAHWLVRPRMPMTVQARYRRARHLIDAGKYLEAASHLARVAASSEPFSRLARYLLAQTISAMCHKRRRSSVSRRLRQSVREQAAHSWLRPSDLECVLCTNTYTNPVSTPCGHTYCRECIERSLYYNKKCALCLSSLENFNLAETRDTVFISSILSSIDVLPLPDETDVMPVVTCHVAYPGMPCPLFVFNPRYCQMVQRVLESGSRRFGMLAYNYANYGTVLEIRDCVVFEDKSCIVSTVGVSRFRVVERYNKDGCDVGHIQTLADYQLPRVAEIQLQVLATQVYRKALAWLNTMDERTKSVREEIQTAFGSLPYDVEPEELGKTSDGPYWLWWLVAILPLNREIKFLILSTRSLLKRMLAVSRALDLVTSDLRIDASSEDANSEEWFPRS